MTELSQKAARRLTLQIKKGFVDIEKLLDEAIIHNVWQPLGYLSFTEWYDTEMRDINLARGARNLVVITMFAEKSTTRITDGDIAEMVGVSTSAIKEIKRSWNAGLLNFVPPLKSGRKRPERRKWTRNFRWMGFRAKIELHDEVQVWGRANNKPLSEIQEEALELWADLNIRKGVEPSPAERKPTRRARTTEAKFQAPPPAPA